MLSYATYEEEGLYNLIEDKTDLSFQAVDIGQQSTLIT